MSNVTFVRAVPAILVALLLPLAAGCGSSGSAGNAASAVPEDVAVYLSVDTSFEGGQWRAVRDLLARFPDGEGALDELLDEASDGAGLSTERLKEALGPEVGIAVLDIPTGSGGSPEVVVLSRPDDEDAFRELLEGEEAVVAEVDGWQVAAPDQATLDRYRAALEGPTLESSAEFDETMDDLGDGLVHAYVDGEAIMKAFASQPGFPAGALPLPGGGELGSIGAVLEAEGDGLRLEGRAVVPEGAEDTPSGEAYSSELLEEVPSGALAFVSFKGLGEGLEAGAGGMEAFLPFDLGEVAGLLAEETAIYVRPGQPEPAITLVTEVDDEAAALRTVAGLAGLAGPEGAGIAYDAFDGLLAVSTSQAEIAALRGDGPRLDQDDAFERAAEQAGLPDETTGFGYVDLEAAVPFLLGLAPAGDGDAAEAKAYLEPLGSIVFWGGRTGAVQDFSLFVGIE